MLSRRPNDPPNTPLVLGLDVGTTRVKAMVFDAGGSPVTEPSSALTPRDPAELVEGVASVIDQQVDEADEISAVGISCYWHGLLVLDQKGRPAGEIKSWQDLGAEESALELSAVIDPSDYHRRTGCFLHPSYPAMKIHRLLETGGAPDGARFAGPAEWLIRSLFGRFATSSSMAGATGLARIGGEAYDPEVLSAVGVSEDRLPVIDDGTPAGLVPEFAQRWPSLTEARWLSPVGDGACAAAGSGCLTAADRAALSIGTSAAVRLITNSLPEAPDGLFVYSLPGGRSLVGGAVSNAGNLMAWARRALGLDDEDLEKALSQAEGSHRLAVRPYLAGRRSPDWPTDSEAVIEGVTLETSGIDLLQALVEAASEDIASMVGQLESWAGSLPDLVASGGVVERHPAWVRLICRKTGRRLHQAPEENTAALGAALLAMEGLGVPLPSLPLGESIC
ncbi:MAG: FGGY family carbohydrate kinase [Actinomycetota bacterium]